MKKTIENHCCPKVNVSFERINLFKAVQKDEESFDDFLRRIKTFL